MSDARVDAPTTPCPSSIPYGVAHNVGGVEFRISMALDSGQSCNAPKRLKAFVSVGATGAYFKTLTFSGGMSSHVNVPPGQTVTFPSSTYCFQELMPAHCDVVGPYNP